MKYSVSKEGFFGDCLQYVIDLEWGDGVGNIIFLILFFKILFVSMLGCIFVLGQRRVYEVYLGSSFLY